MTAKFERKFANTIPTGLMFNFFVLKGDKMFDWFSFGVGVLVATILTIILMFLLLIWSVSKAYMIGWHDHKEGKHVDFLGLFPFFLQLIIIKRNLFML